MKEDNTNIFLGATYTYKDIGGMEAGIDSGGGKHGPPPTSVVIETIFLGATYTYIYFF